MGEYSICCSLDSNYAEQLCTAAASILKNSSDTDRIRFYLLDGGLKKIDKLKLELLRKIKDFKIEYIKMNDADFADCPILKNKDEKYKHYHVTLPTYYRFLLSDLLKNQDKVLYLDCDVIVKDSLQELFNENIEGFAAAMVLDAESNREAQRLNIDKYFNAGVMLINLDYWRKNNVKEKLFEYAAKNKDKILWQDQDIINAVLSGTVKELPEIWNYQYFQYEHPDSSRAAQAYILHLAGRFKPWLMPFESEVYDEYYDYLKLTPFKNRAVKYRLNSAGKRLKNNTGGSVTNIIKFAADEDINKCWQEIDKNYKYFFNQKEEAETNLDNKISNIYDEISKNYKYTNDKLDASKKEITAQTDEKISKVYDEISKNYQYTNEKSDTSKKEITVQTDEKISRVYDEISKNYKYTDAKHNNLKEELSGILQSIKSAEKLAAASAERCSIQSEEYAGMLQNNIVNVHKYIDEKNYQMIKDFQENLDKRISESRLDYNNLLKDELSKGTEELNLRIDRMSAAGAEYTDKKSIEIQALSAEYTDKKSIEIQALSAEYTDKKSAEIQALSAEYTDKEISELKTETAEIQKAAEENLSKTKSGLLQLIDEYKAASQRETEGNKKYIEEQTHDVKIRLLGRLEEKTSELQNEIIEALQYTDEKVLGAGKSLRQDIEEKSSEIKELINKRIEMNSSALNADLAAAKSALGSSMQELEDKVLSELNENRRNIEIQSERFTVSSKETDVKISGVYSYINEQTADLYKEMRAVSVSAENAVNSKIADVYRLNEECFRKTAALKDEMDFMPKMETIKELEKNFDNKSAEKEYKYTALINDLKSEFEYKLNEQRIKYENKLIEAENEINELKSAVSRLKKSPAERFIERFRKNKKK